MSITKQFKKVSNRMVAVIVGLSVLSVLLLAAVLYETNTIRFGGNVSAEEIYSLVEDNPTVKEYLQSEKDYEAHFVTIASLVEEDQQKALGRSLLIVTVPVALLAAAIGYLVSQYILRPVRESYESQERFMQDAAHELRNPLAAMNLAIENQKQNPGDNSEFIKTMQRQNSRLVRITEDLLYLERRTPGGEIKSINISNLLEDVLEDMQPVINKKNLKITTKVQSNVHLKIDQKDFIKLSRNIIENAIKFSKPGKTINVLLAQDNQILFEVKDKGIGMSKEDLEHIGERFYRAKNASKIDGSGLGIAIVNKVINIYGGQLDISSKVGTGTTVKITF